MMRRLLRRLSARRSSSPSSTGAGSARPARPPRAARRHGRGGPDPSAEGSAQEEGSTGATRRGVVREYARSIGLAVGVALLLRAFVVEAYMVPSGSMIPTLQVGDHLMANKFVYGLTIPFTTTKLINGRSPKVGEVIIFTHPRSGETLIKRVVAVGGDVVQMKDQVLYRNGKPVSLAPVSGACRYRDDPEPGADGPVDWRACRAFTETLGSRPHPVYYDAQISWRDFPQTRVPEGQVFVMGDNRDNSGDSRLWGPVPLSHVKGKALFFWWSRGPDGVRWSRMFTAVK